MINILKNALFLQPLYFESNFEKCWFLPRVRVRVRVRVRARARVRVKVRVRQ